MRDITGTFTHGAQPEQLLRSVPEFGCDRLKLLELGVLKDLDELVGHSSGSFGLVEFFEQTPLSQEQHRRVQSPMSAVAREQTRVR